MVRTGARPDGTDSRLQAAPLFGLRPAQSACVQALFRVVSGCGRIGRISRTMATLETGQDPPYVATS